MRISEKTIVREFGKVLPRLELEWEWSRVILEHFCRRRLRGNFDFCVSTRYWRKNEKKWDEKSGAYKLKIRGDGWQIMAGEYLVDLCWYKIAPENYAELAMEVEWQPDREGIDWDFYKLLDVKAP